MRYQLEGGFSITVLRPTKEDAASLATTTEPVQYDPLPQLVAWIGDEHDARLVAVAPKLAEALIAYQQANRLHNDSEAVLWAQAEEALRAAGYDPDA
jgi:hypothetical protein